MNYGVEICLRELLFEQECVIIPNFGGFLSQYKSAEIDHLQHLIYPPTKTISFNRQLKNDDGLLANTYSLLNNVSFAEAAVIVKNWATNFEENLKKNESAVLPKIGTFKWDKKTSTIAFEFDETQNYLAESYGLLPVNAVPIQRNAPVLSPIAPIVEMVQKNEEDAGLTAPFLNNKKKKRDYSSVVSFVAGVAFALALTLPIFNIHAPNLNLNEANVFSVFSKWFEPKTINAEPIAFDNNAIPPVSTDIKVGKPNFVSEVKAEKKAIVVANEVVPTAATIENSKYQIVLGSFTKADNAENYVAKIKSENVSLNVVFYKKGTRNYVAIPAGNNEAEARKVLEKTKADYDCWLKSN